MTRDDIIQMAREAQEVSFASGSNVWTFSTEGVEHFAVLVAAEEREACAELCDDLADLWDDDGHPGKAAGARMCASDIREINE